MHLAFILSSLSLSGGVRVIIEYANRLSKRGYEITLIAPGNTLADEYKYEIGPNIKIIETKTLLKETMGFWEKIQLVLNMISKIPKVDYIISTHTPTTLISLIAGKVLRKGTPIWFFQDYPGMFEKRKFESFLLRKALKWHAGALTISNYSKKLLEDYGYHKPIFVVSEGISRIHLFSPIQKDEREKNKNYKPTIFYLGDKRPRKGFNEFLRAAEIVSKSITGLTLWISSKEPLNFSTTVQSKFFLRPTDSELAILYGSCDVFVSASWWEGFGLPPLEAMACGAPVVTTDSQGVRDFVDHRNNCLIVPIRNPEALAAAILEVLINHDLSERLRKNGPVTAAKFSWENATDRFEHAINELSRQM